MAGEYDINLSNGSILATLYPLEVNGPDNLSTPRFIQGVNTSLNTFTLNDDLTSRFVAGFQFVVQGSAGGLNDGTYTVAPAGSTFAAGQTTIPVTTAVTSAALPLGEIQYSVLDSRTTLTLPGRGTLNYGEYLIDNFVHLLENFAADVEPDANTNIGSSPFGEPLTGQWWYKTLAGQEGFKYYDGTQWTSNLDIDDGALIFRDVEDSNKDIYITASETNLPAPWAGGANNQPGFVIWSQVNPAVEEPLFRVLSSGGAEQLRVEHDGRVETDGALYVKNITSYGDNNIFDGNLGIGGGTFDGTVDKTLTVEGDGIQVNSDTANNATLVLNSPVGMTSHVDFSHGGVLKGNITVNDAIAGDPLELNSAVANDVVLVTGGGNVGINQVAPSRRLDVVGESEFNGDVYVINSDEIFNNGYGLESVAGAQLKTGGGGGTWQTTPAAGTAASFVANDFAGNPTFLVDENTGTEVRLYDFFVDTDTLYVDAVNDRVGINIVPAYPLDVVGNTHIAGRVGINQAPPVTNVPVGTDIWLAVTGDIQANSQFLGSNGASSEPTYSWTTDTDTGFYLSAPGSFHAVTSGSLRFDITNAYLSSRVQHLFSTGSAASPSISHALDSNTGIFFVNPDVVGVSTNGVERLRVEADGTLSVTGTTDYETLVTDDDDIPNKRYVDDAITAAVGAISWREPVVVRDQSSRANQAAFPTGGVIDGVTLSVGDRVLFSDVTNVADRDIWIWNGAGWDADTLNTRNIGDATYVQDGSNAGKAYAFNKDDEWAIITGSGGGTFFLREQFTAAPGQIVFSLANGYKLTPDGSRLLVYVDGVKYIYGSGYAETDATTVTLSPPVPFVGGELVEFYSLTETTSNASLKREQQTGLTGNPLITLTSISYVVGADELMVFFNGQKAILGIDYTEATSNTFNWIGTPLVATDVLELLSGVPVVAGTLLTDIDDVAPTPPNDGDVLIYNSTSGLWEPSTQPGVEDGVNFDELIANGAGTQTVFNTVNVSTTTKTGSTAYQQVFVNGVLQKEGAAFAYTVTGPSQITFNAPVVANADVTIYQL